MTCSDFIQSYTDFIDGEASEGLRDAAEAHLRTCGKCRRYHQVVTRGGEVLRTLPEAQVPEDFHPRLVHRIYHVDDERALVPHLSSGTTFLAVLGMSVVLTAVAWAPTLRPQAPVVELAPILVTDPPSRVRPANLLPDGTLLRPLPGADRRGLWDDAERLLYEYSPLQQRYRERPTLRQVGVDQDR